MFADEASSGSVTTCCVITSRACLPSDFLLAMLPFPPFAGCAGRRRILKSGAQLPPTGSAPDVANDIARAEAVLSAW